MRAPHSRLFLMEDDLFMKKAVLMLLVIALLVFPFAALGQTMKPYETIDLDLGEGFTQHGSVPQLLARAGLDANSIAEAAMKLLEK